MEVIFAAGVGEGSGGWALFTFAYMTGLAYVGALIVYHGAMLLGLGGVGT